MKAKTLSTVAAGLLIGALGLTACGCGRAAGPNLVGGNNGGMQWVGPAPMQWAGPNPNNQNNGGGQFNMLPFGPPAPRPVIRPLPRGPRPLPSLGNRFPANPWP